MMETSLSFEDLVFSYGDQEALHGVSAQVESGKITALFGPNGSGKTTLLRCLAGLARPQSGSIWVKGQELRRLRPRQAARLISYVPQEHGVSFGFTVEEVVLMGRTPYLGGIQGPAVRDYEAAGAAIEAVGIAEIRNRPYTDLSGGQRQLVLIARALAQESPVIIMDEPTSALDFKNQILVWKQLRTLRQGGRTILVCTHDPNHVLWFCDDVLVLREGRLLAQGPVETLVTKERMEELYGSACTVQNGAVVPVL